MLFHLELSSFCHNYLFNSRFFLDFSLFIFILYFCGFTYILYLKGEGSKQSHKCSVCTDLWVRFIHLVFKAVYLTHYWYLGPAMSIGSHLQTLYLCLIPILEDLGRSIESNPHFHPFRGDGKIYGSLLYSAVCPWGVKSASAALSLL